MLISTLHFIWVKMNERLFLLILSSLFRTGWFSWLSHVNFTLFHGLLTNLLATHVAGHQGLLHGSVWISINPLSLRKGRMYSAEVGSAYGDRRRMACQTLWYPNSTTDINWRKILAPGSARDLTDGAPDINPEVFQNWYKRGNAYFP